MPETLSPKQVARAIGVSESSLKRWCDQGLIPFSKTVGGHRRLSLDDVVAFIRAQGYEVLDPEAMRLPILAGQTHRTLDRAKEELVDALGNGDEGLCRQIVTDLYLQGHPAAKLCDEVLAAAFHEIGDRWECGHLEVYEERRACELCLRVVFHLRTLLPQVSNTAPVALGGTLDGDPYTLAVSMAEIVLWEAGFRAMSLGHMLPFATLHSAIRKHRPRLIWLSISAIRDDARFATEMNQLFDTALEHDTALVVGGVALTEDVRKAIRYSAYCDTFAHLDGFARALLQPHHVNGKDNPATQSAFLE